MCVQDVRFTFKLVLKVDSNQGAVLLLTGAREIPTIITQGVTDRITAFKNLLAGKPPAPEEASRAALTRSTWSSRSAVVIPAQRPQSRSYVDTLTFRQEKRYVRAAFPHSPCIQRRTSRGRGSDGLNRVQTQTGRIHP